MLAEVKFGLFYRVRELQNMRSANTWVNKNLTAHELPDELQFRVEYELTWISRVLLPWMFYMLVSVILFVSLILSIDLFLAGMTLVGGLIGIIAFRRMRRRYSKTLSVTSQRLEVSGDEGFGILCSRTFKRVVLVSEIRNIGFNLGNTEINHVGLYVNSGIMSGKMLLDELDPMECKAVIDRISLRFPEIGLRVAQKK